MKINKESKKNILLIGIIIFCITNQCAQLQNKLNKINEISERITLTKIKITNKLQEFNNQELFLLCKYKN